MQFLLSLEVQRQPDSEKAHLFIFSWSYQIMSEGKDKQSAQARLSVLAKQLKPVSSIGHTDDSISCR